MRRASLCLWFFLPLVSLSAQGLSTSPPEVYAISTPELTRLLTISEQLKELSISLSDKLTASQASLSRQAIELTELKEKIEFSETLSDQLKKTLAESEASLASLQISFLAYKAEAEAEIKRLNRKLLFWKIAGGVAIASGVAIAIVF
jgi:hypothetical protein